jgi:hypothetical protein
LEELVSYRQGLLERLAQLPSAYRQALAGSQPAPPEANPDHSPQALLAHVCLAEENIFLPAIRRILDEDMPLLDGDEAGKGEAIAYARPAGVLLDDMKALHRDLLALLGSLPSADWGRRGRHPRLGLRTVQWWVERCRSHGEEHLDQVKEAAGRFTAKS